MEGKADISVPSHFVIEDQICDPQTFADNLNSYYVNIAKSTLINSVTSTRNIPVSCTGIHPVSIGEVKLALKNINSRKSTHSDDYPSWITKSSHEDLCVPVTAIINRVFRTGVFPELYKSAEVTPIAKNSSPAAYKDYRPISLLWHIGKVIELFINKRLRQEMMPYLHTNQFAYKSGVGCTDALVTLFDDVTRALDSKNNFGAQLIMFDFSKAFDMMHHGVLLEKLTSLGVSSGVRSVVGSYLTGRKQCVHLRAHSVKSPVQSVTVGVPQGTLCGPTLWLAFVNSLQFTQGTTIKYADDTTTCYGLSHTNTQVISKTASNVTFKAPEAGQHLIDSCILWSAENQMVLNAAKTKVINISIKKNLEMRTSLSMFGSDVGVVEDARLLGVCIDSHMNFTSHVHNISLTAKRKLYGLVLLKRSGVNESSLLSIYSCQVVPAITYAAAAWFPFTNLQQRAEIDRVQHVALRIVYPELASYEERLEISGLPTLPDLLSKLCKRYCAQVAHPDHHMHSRLPPKQSTNRHSIRLFDCYRPAARTSTRGKCILSNSEFLLC
jgi:hypothetical protein